MQDVLWITLAICAAALTGVLIPLLLTLRQDAKKAGQTLDQINGELPALLSNARAAVEEAREAARSLKNGASFLGHTGETALGALGPLLGMAGSFGGKFAKLLSLVFSFVQGAKAAASVFGGNGKRPKDSKEEETHKSKEASHE